MYPISITRTISTLRDKVTPAASVRISILSGDVEEAIALLEEHFPSVLSLETSSVAQVPPLIRQPVPKVFDPGHLLLTLRLLSFIESARTIPLPYTIPGIPLSTRRARSNTSRSSSSDGSESDSELSSQRTLVEEAQFLFAEAARLLKPTDRLMYLGRLAEVSALVSYPVPEESPMASYLAMNKREAVADQIEGAILYRMEKSNASVTVS